MAVPSIFKWVYIKDSSEEAGEDCGWVDGLTVGTTSLTAPPNELGEAVDCDLKFTTTGTDGATWSKDNGPDSEYYYESDAMKSYDTLDPNGESWLQTIVESDSAETFKFYWKVSCEENYGYLEFYIDNQLQHSITGEVDWTQKSYTISAGIHILKWRYTNGEGDEGDDCGWVDFVQWTGPSPAQDPDNWQEITYKHDVHGRRIEKKVDGYSTRYLHDGDHVIAEYDGNNNLLRKYIYGPGMDQPVSMIEVADSNAAYYYHFDALGSVIALSDSSGDTVQIYEYSVYGEVAVEDANHTNPYMFAGRRYDIEIGLYYNRARYYNPYMGRFLQTDPIGYEDGMNLYRYCMNNPVNWVDPSGYLTVAIPAGGILAGEGIGAAAGAVAGVAWPGVIAGAVGFAGHEAVEELVERRWLDGVLEPIAGVYADYIIWRENSYRLDRQGKGGGGEPVPGSERVHWDHDHYPWGRPHRHWKEKFKNPRGPGESIKPFTGPWPPRPGDPVVPPG